MIKLKGRIPFPAAGIGPWVELVPIRAHNPQAAGRLELTGFPGMGLRLDLFDAAGELFAVVELEAEDGEGFPEL